MANYIGIDVSKLSLELYIPAKEKNYQLPNNGKGFATLQEQIDKYYQLSEVILVFEPTGGYEKNLEYWCKLKEIQYIKVHPNKVRYYAKASGLLAKTDKIDCKLLTDYALHFALPPQSDYKSQSQQELVSLIKRKDQLMLIKQQEHCRLEAENNNLIKGSIVAHIEYLHQQLKTIEQHIDQLCKTNEEIDAKITKLTSIPGVGNTLAIAAICHAPELGNMPLAKITSLIGLAPFARESGSYKGGRSIFGGRAYLRKILYMASVASLRANKKLKLFYDRLIAKHKPAKVALVAVMRKMLALMHTILKNNTYWQNNQNIA